MIKAGQQVKFKPEWQDKGDENKEFFAIEDECGGRVRVEMRGVLKSFNPVQVVTVDMIEPEQPPKV